MGNDDFIAIAKAAVYEYYNDIRDVTDSKDITLDDIYIVWISKVLQNNKALLSTTLSDGKYYEATYNGDKKELYLDVYVKLVNTKHRVIDTEGNVHITEKVKREGFSYE